MSLLSGSGTTLPNNLIIYDVKIPTFTVASGATGGTYAVTGTTYTYPLNTAKNVTNIAGNNQIVFPISYFVSCLVTTNTTDNTTLLLQYSTNGGAAWNSYDAGLGLTAAQQNKSATNSSGGAAGQAVSPGSSIGINTPITDWRLRLVITDATDPTTNALTITNLRATALMMILI